MKLVRTLMTKVEERNDRQLDQCIEIVHVESSLTDETTIYTDSFFRDLGCLLDPDRRFRWVSCCGSFERTNCRMTVVACQGVGETHIRFERNYESVGIS